MSDYYFLITDAGKALEVVAHASGETVKLTDFAVGDGGGEPVTPDASQTALVNEAYRDVISSLTVNKSDASVLEAECVIPSSSGGYTIREVGIFADDGTLYAVGNYPDQDKPAPDSGFAASLDIFAELAVSDTSDIQLMVQDGSYLTEPQADTIYLRQDKRLGEIAGQGPDAQSAARVNIGCGTAAAVDVATSNTDITPGRAVTSGWMGWGGIALPVSTTSNDDLHQLPGFTYSAVREYKSSDGSAYLMGISGVSASGNLAEWLAPENGSDGTKVAIRNKDNLFTLYSDKHKPSSSDVDAVSASQGGTFKKEITATYTGGKTWEEQYSTKAAYYNVVTSTTTTSEYWPLIKQKFSISGSTSYGYAWSMGALISGGAGGTPNITIQSKGSAGNEQKWTFNISNGQFVPSSYGNFDARYQAKGSYYTQSESNAKFVQGVQFGASASHPVSNNQSFNTAGYCLTGFVSDGNNDDVDSFYAKPIQKNINGTWTIISG